MSVNGPDYDNIDDIGVMIEKFEQRFSFLLRDLERAKGNDVQQVSNISFSKEYNQTLETTIESLTEFKKTLLKDSRKVWSYLSDHIDHLSFEEVEKAHDYFAIVEEIRTLENRCVELTDVIPTLIQLTRYQSKSEALARPLEILNLLTQKIVKMLGQSPELILSFGNAFSFIPLNSMSHSVISAPVSTSYDFERWIPIGHEIGHWLWKKYSMLEEFIDFTYESGLGSSLNDHNYRWGSEFFSDIVMTEFFSTRSFSSFGQEVCFRHALDYSDTHPPNVLRITMMGKYLLQRLPDRGLPDEIGEIPQLPYPEELKEPWLDNDYLNGLVNLWTERIKKIGLSHPFDEFQLLRRRILDKESIEAFSIRTLIASLVNQDDSRIRVRVLEEIEKRRG